MPGQASYFDPRTGLPRPEMLYQGGALVPGYLQALQMLNTNAKALGASAGNPVANVAQAAQQIGVPIQDAPATINRQVMDAILATTNLPGAPSSPYAGPPSPNPTAPPDGNEPPATPPVDWSMIPHGAQVTASPMFGQSPQAFMQGLQANPLFARFLR